MKYTPLIFVSTLLTACLGGSDSSSKNGQMGGIMNQNPGGMQAPTMDMSGGMPGGATETAEMVTFPSLTTKKVDVALSFSVTKGDQTHIVGADKDGQNRIRLTGDSAPWSYHSIDPTGRYLVAVRHSEVTANGRPDLESPGIVWVIDFEEKSKRDDGTIETDEMGTAKPLAYALTPENCNAGLGGVGWASATTIAFAMSCGEEKAKAYLAQSSERSRDASQFKVISDHDAPVRDVNPALDSSFFTYVVDAEVCLNDTCVIKPSIWVGDSQNTTSKCQVTDGDRQFLEDASHTQSKRVGDHQPAMGPGLRSITFSRNVGQKTKGPSGHHDIMRVGLNTNALFMGGDRCNQAGTDVNLSDALYTDEYDTPDLMTKANARERFIQYGLGSKAPEDTLLFVARAGESNAETSILYLGGANSDTKTPITDASEWIVYARWAVDDFQLSGGSR